MNSTATLQEESSMIGGTSSVATAAPLAEVVYREFGPTRPLPIANTTSLQSLIDEFESEPEFASHLAEARRDLATTLYADEANTLTALRLSAGMSQAKLAAGADTTQPYIARIERGQVDPGTEMIERIAQALGASPDCVFLAIREQRRIHG
ncbi:helix-turn-helix domain-containing protein [Thiobacillus sp.]